MHHDSVVLRRAGLRRGAAALTFVALTAGTATGGTATNLDSGSLASTGAGGIGLLVAAAAALATVGFAAFRLAPRLRLRSRDDA